MSAARENGDAVSVHKPESIRRLAHEIIVLDVEQLPGDRRERAAPLDLRREAAEAGPGAGNGEGAAEGAAQKEAGNRESGIGNRSEMKTGLAISDFRFTISV